MINLLPLEEKQKLIFKKKEKLSTIWGIILLVSMVCLTLILLSIKFYILAETDGQNIILRQTEKQNQTPDSVSSINVIKRYNKILAQVDSFYKKEIYFNQALNITMNVPSPADLYFTNISLTRDAKGMAQAAVSGISDTRENLLIFKKNIESEQKINNPVFSPESWISPKNVNFSLTFSISQNEK